MSVHKLPPAAPSQHRLAASTTSGDASERVVLPFPVADTPGRPYLRPHRMAHANRDEEMIAALFEQGVEHRLREGSPQSGARHVRIVGPNEFEDEDTPGQISDVAIMIGSFVMVFGIAVWWF